MSVRYCFPTEIVASAGAVHQLPKIMETRQLGQVVLMAAAEDLERPWLARLLNELPKDLVINRFPIAEGVHTLEGLMVGANYLTQTKPDAIIALGDEGAIDFAKTTRMLQHHESDVLKSKLTAADLCLHSGSSAALIIIPTTPAANQAMEPRVRLPHPILGEYAVRHPHLLPDVLLVDAELLIDASTQLTTHTGLDVLCQLLETILSRHDAAVSDAIAMSGLQMVHSHLAETIHMAALNESGRHLSHTECCVQLETKETMLTAAILAGLASPHGGGLTESCAHAIATMCSVHRGFAKAVILVPCMKYYADYVPERFNTIAKALSLRETTVASFFDWLKKTLHDLGIPSNLTEIGIDETQVPDLVDTAFNDDGHTLGPRAINREQLHSLFLEALNR